jgi:hypothetical protein
MKNSQTQSCLKTKTRREEKLKRVKIKGARITEFFIWSKE